MNDSVPLEVRPWLLLGDRRRRALEHRFRAVAEGWAARWVARPITLSISIEPAAKSPLLEYVDRNWISFGARGKSGEWLQMIRVPPRLVAWAAGLDAVEFAALADTDDVSLSGEVELDVVRGFCDRQATAMDAPLECLDEASAEEARRILAKRGLSVVCAFGPAPGLQIQLTLAPGMVATLLAERRSNYEGESLQSRRAALAQAPLALDCCLGSVQVPVRELHSLRVGDVLVTDLALSGHAELRVRSKSRSIAVGTIGAVAGRKAIKVETAQVITGSRGLRR
jgi:hypothetical protein